jgi:hypothetical protein
MRLLRRLYNWTMFRWHGWLLHRHVSKMRRAGKKHGLPSLDAYSDEGIVEGFRRLKSEKQTPT